MVGICKNLQGLNVRANEPPVDIVWIPVMPLLWLTTPQAQPFSYQALCVHQNPLMGFWAGTARERHRLMSDFPLADMVKKGTRLTAVRPRMEGDYGLENSHSQNFLY